MTKETNSFWKRLFPCVIVLMPIFLVGCSGGSNPFEILAGTDGELTIVNATGATIYFTAFERGSLATILIGFQSCPDDPNRIRPFQQRSLVVNEIWEYEPGDEAVLFWWTAGREKEENDCYEAVRISSMILSAELLLHPASKIVIRGFAAGD